jgi:hypothetical protein
VINSKSLLEPLEASVTALDQLQVEVYSAIPNLDTLAAAK